MILLDLSKPSVLYCEGTSIDGDMLWNLIMFGSRIRSIHLFEKPLSFTSSLHVH